ncbi:MAG: hypothetical protein IPK16_33305 [Anaerolineales bacterium]|nr:hypothetical protein [Anaerolineales bacterium]
MQRTGEWETVRSFDKINNQNLREILHLEQVMVRLPQELSQRSRADRGLRIYQPYWTYEEFDAQTTTDAGR